MCRIFPALAFLLALLPGCRYESTADLRSSVTPYRVTGAFPEGNYLFQTKDQSKLLKLTVQKDMAHLSFQDQGRSPVTATIVSLLGSDSFPKSHYVAMAMGGKTDKGQRYHYYPFNFNDKHIKWIKPATETEVYGLADLAEHMTKAQRDDIGLSFHLVPEQHRGSVQARFDAWRESTASKSTTPETSRTPPPQVQTAPTVRGYSVGDGVFVQGFLSDSPSIIQEIDEANGRVKVMRYEDGITEWVSSNRIISRGQSTVNNVGRTVGTIGVIVCMVSPETCKPEPK